MRKKIEGTFRSPALKAALLAELNSAGEDAALVVEMMERVKPITTPPVQAVAPRLHQGQPAAPPGPVPVPRIVPEPVPVADGSSEEVPVEVLDSEEELVQEMVLSPRRAQRLRRQLQVWRERGGSSSD